LYFIWEAAWDTGRRLLVPWTQPLHRPSWSSYHSRSWCLSPNDPVQTQKDDHATDLLAALSAHNPEDIQKHNFLMPKPLKPMPYTIMALVPYRSLHRQGFEGAIGWTNWPKKDVELRNVQRSNDMVSTTNMRRAQSVGNLVGNSVGRLVRKNARPTWCWVTWASNDQNKPLSFLQWARHRISVRWFKTRADPTVYLIPTTVSGVIIVNAKAQSGIIFAVLTNSFPCIWRSRNNNYPGKVVFAWYQDCTSAAIW